MDRFSPLSYKDLTKKKKVILFWNYMLPERWEDSMLALPINITQSGDEAKCLGLWSYFISLKFHGNRAWLFQVPCPCLGLLQITVIGIISDPRRAPGLWDPLNQQSTLRRCGLPLFTLLTSEILCCLLLFKRKRNMSSVFWNEDQKKGSLTLPLWPCLPLDCQKIALTRNAHPSSCSHPRLPKRINWSSTVMCEN